MDLAFDASRAHGYSSASQVARVLTQDWVERKMFCLACSEARLTATPQNTRSRDFFCASCEEPYELKSTHGRFGRSILDGEYRTMLSAIQRGRAANLLLLQYDARASEVRDLVGVHRNLLTSAAIVPRKAPLPPSARRAGWRGCSIDLSAVASDARIPVVLDGVARDPTSVRYDWSRFSFLVRLRPESRGWLADTLAFVDHLPPDRPFHLSEAYGFAGELRELHPNNRHIEPKIRQQLQLLVAHGLLRRVRRGLYERIPHRPDPSSGMAPLPGSRPPT